MCVYDFLWLFILCVWNERNHKWNRTHQWNRFPYKICRAFLFEFVWVVLNQSEDDNNIHNNNNNNNNHKFSKEIEHFRYSLSYIICVKNLFFEIEVTLLTRRRTGIGCPFGSVTLASMSSFHFFTAWNELHLMRACQREIMKMCVWENMWVWEWESCEGENDSYLSI
jgi:hypothetical protein